MMDSVDMCFCVCVCLSVFVDQVNRYVFLKHSVFLIDFHNSHRFTILTLIYFLFSLTCHEILHAGIHSVSEQSLIWLPLDSDTVPGHRKRRLSFAHKKIFKEH